MKATPVWFRHINAMQPQTRGIDTELHNTASRKRIDPWGQHFKHRWRLPMPGFGFGMGVVNQRRPAAPLLQIPKVNRPEGEGFRWMEVCPAQMGKVIIGLLQ